MMKCNLLCLEIQRRETETEKDKNKTNKQSNKTAKKKKDRVWRDAQSSTHGILYFLSTFTFHTSHFALQILHFKCSLSIHVSVLCVICGQLGSKRKLPSEITLMYTKRPTSD